MIANLSIKNYALIDDISVDFKSGLTIITGETGAGKSILLGALTLLLGKRADLSSIKNTSKKCVIEAEFSLDGYNIEKLFKENDLDYDTHTIVRRELLPSGKSRAFVNDTPVTLAQLQALAPYLVDIHGQLETLELFSETFQLEVIDTLAGNEKLLKKYLKLLGVFLKITETISELKNKKENATKELDYNTFLFNELEKLNLNELNQELLEERYEILNNTETIQEAVSNILKLTSEEQIGTLTTAKEARLLLGKLRNISSKFSTYWNRLNSCIIELEDIFEGIQETASNIESDPSALYEINEKLQALYKIQQKHSVATVIDLLEIQNTLASLIDNTLNLETRISDLEIEQQKLREKVSEIADTLHVKRMEVIPILKAKLEEFLSELSLPNAQFEFNIVKADNFRKNGRDNLQMLFTANKGIAFEPLKKVASGGELSRIMLAIKAVLAQYKKLPTLIFDEIDSGVSGEIAYKMAEILSTMSKTMQMICITHLAQIAAKGDHHIKIFKEDVNEVTVTRLKTLNETERIEEIAEMIGGKQRTDAAIIHAKELLN